jgi:hypothetical protein
MRKQPECTPPRFPLIAFCVLVHRPDGIGRDSVPFDADKGEIITVRTLLVNTGDTRTRFDRRRCEHLQRV